MAQHKSAAKRARQAVKKNTVNSNRKSKVRTGEKSLLTHNRLPNKRYSDHLPLFFTLKLNKL